MKRDIDPQNKPKSEFIEYTKFKCYCKSGYSTLDKNVHNYITKKCICKKICKCKRYACTKSNIDTRVVFYPRQMLLQGWPNCPQE